jgi:hypothetical protein
MNPSIFVDGTYQSDMSGNGALEKVWEVLCACGAVYHGSYTPSGTISMYYGFLRVPHLLPRFLIDYFYIVSPIKDINTSSRISFEQNWLFITVLSVTVLPILVGTICVWYNTAKLPPRPLSTDDIPQHFLRYFQKHGCVHLRAHDTEIAHEPLLQLSLSLDFLSNKRY